MVEATLCVPTMQARHYFWTWRDAVPPSLQRVNEDIIALHDTVQRQCFAYNNPCYGSYYQLCSCLCTAACFSVTCLASTRLRRLRSVERLLKVSNDIINMLCANRNSNKVLSRISRITHNSTRSYLRDTRSTLLFIRELLMSRRPWVNRQGL